MYLLKSNIMGILPVHNGGVKMSKVVILKIDTLSHVFTTLESGSKCQFQYELINNDKISNVIQPLVVNDAVLCVFDDVVKIALRVVSKTFDKVTLTKEIELNEGFQITDKNILRVLNDTQIYECNVDFKKNLYESLTGNFKSTLRQLFEIDITEEKEINSFFEKHNLDGSTPITIFIKDGQETSILNRLEGDVDREQIIERFKKMDLI